MLEEILFHVVFRKDVLTDDLVIVGIYTMRQDAELLKFNLIAHGFAKVARLELSLNAIKQYLMHESVGKLSDVLFSLEQIHADLGGNSKSIYQATA